jgi:hypothetical protein
MSNTFMRSEINSELEYGGGSERIIILLKLILEK